MVIDVKLQTYNGMPVYLNSYLVDTTLQIKRTRSYYRPRLAKRFKKRPVRRYTTPSKRIIFADNRFIMHPMVWRRLQEKAT